MVLSRRSPADRRLEPVRYASVSPSCSKGTTSHSTSNETASATPLAIAAHAPALTNRESPSEGSASEGTSIPCCCACCVVVVIIIYSFSLLGGNVVSFLWESRASGGDGTSAKRPIVGTHSSERG